MRKIRKLGKMAGTVILISALCLGTIGCGSDDGTAVSELKSFLSEEQSNDLGNSQIKSVNISDYVEYKESDNYSDYSDGIKISLNGSKATCDSSNVTVAEGTITINEEGTYVLSGNYSGTVIIDASEEAKVILVLENANITGTSGPAIWEKSADKVTVLLPENTNNSLTDPESYSDTSEEAPTATLYCEDSLSFAGTGSLTVKGNTNDGITSKGKLKITEGNITINAKDDGIVGKKLVAVKTGSISINCDGDGIKTTESEDLEKGNIVLENGTYTIVSGKDAIQSANILLITGGSFNIKTGNGAGEFDTSSTGGFDDFRKTTSSSTTSEESLKGLKATNEISVYGGSFVLDTEDDGVHTNGNLNLSNCDMQIATGDDGLHADKNIVIDNGTYTISKSYEGIEANIITINGGTIDVTSSDDGFNANGGNDGSGFGGFFGKFDGNWKETASQGNASSTDEKQEETDATTETPYIYINGGNITVNAYGDGLDSNGNIEMNGGTVYVSGSTDGSNNATDYAGSFIMNGGLIVATGSSGMYQSISDDSKCSSVDYIAGSSISEGTECRLMDGDNEICSFVLKKSADAILISCTEIVDGQEYTMVTGDTETSVTAGAEVNAGFGNFGGFNGGGFNGGGPGNGNFQKPDRNNSESDIPELPEGVNPEDFEGEFPNGEFPGGNFDGEFPSGDNFPGTPPTNNNNSESNNS